MPLVGILCVRVCVCLCTCVFHSCECGCVCACCVPVWWVGEGPHINLQMGASATESLRAARRNSAFVVGPALCGESDGEGAAGAQRGRRSGRILPHGASFVARRSARTGDSGGGGGTGDRVTGRDGAALRGAGRSGGDTGDVIIGDVPRGWRGDR